MENFTVIPGGYGRVGEIAQGRLQPEMGLNGIFY